LTGEDEKVIVSCREAVSHGFN
ncbi:hypothetical protein A5828_000424, partial [Enterococcus faecium]